MDYMKLSFFFLLLFVLFLSSLLYRGSVVVIQRSAYGSALNISLLCQEEILKYHPEDFYSVTNKESIALNKGQVNPYPSAKSPKPANSRTDAVIILSMMRSGSSILGSIFNKRSDVTYLYEPLYPFSERPCSTLYSRRVQLLHHIATCNFEKIPALYNLAFQYSGVNDMTSRCKVHNICFASKTTKVNEFLSRDAGMCRTHDGVQICPEPLNLTTLSKFCKQSLLKAIKVIRLCKLEWVESLLEDPNYNIKVIHVVRDPRSTVKSRASPKLYLLDIRKTARQICSDQLIPNIKYADDVLARSKLRDKYMRVRLEDFAWNPHTTTQRIYDFVGINVNEQLRKWIDKATSISNDENLSAKFPQSVIRNSRAVVSQWRKQLSFKKVLEVQKECSEVIEKLGYQLYKSQKELRDLSALHFFPR